MKRVCYLNIVERKCIDSHKSEWLNSIPLKARLITYKNYKRVVRLLIGVYPCVGAPNISAISSSNSTPTITKMSSDDYLGQPKLGMDLLTTQVLDKAVHLK